MVLLKTLIFFHLSAEIIGLSIVVLALLLLLGFVIRLKIKAFQKYYIPSSVIAGFIGLALGPEVLGQFVPEETTIVGGGIFPASFLETWRALPALLITVVFATIFLGKKIAPFREIWNIAGPQVAFGQMIAWGQYVVGIGVVLTVLIPLFDVHPMMGALIEISFEGGIGTTTGLTSTFEAYGFEEGRDIGVGLATVGLIFGLILGIAILNWGVKNKQTKLLHSPNETSPTSLKGVFDPKEEQPQIPLTTRTSAIGTLTIHVAIISLAIMTGYILLKALQMIENQTWGQWVQLRLWEHFPLFPLALIGSVIVQILLNKFIPYPLIHHGWIKSINGFALDFMIASAIASLSLGVIGQHIVPFMTLAIAGITWNLAAFFFIAKYIMPNYWFERSISDFGQSMGMTAVGLLLIRIADPKEKSPALEGFAYKQILFEPIVGGGIFTAASGPLIIYWGLVPMLILTGCLCLGWFLLGYFYFGKKKDPKSV